MLIDARGRLFGRFNLVDTVVVALGVVVAAGVGVAYAAARAKPPAITGVAPATVAAGRRAALQVTGRHFRPYFNAFVARTGAADSVRASREVEFLIGTPTTVELRLPPLDPGSYDIRLFDGSQEVARREMAFLVETLAVHQGS
jgi:Domain of unknown function (DUF4330)